MFGGIPAPPGLGVVQTKPEEKGPKLRKVHWEPIRHNLGDGKETIWPASPGSRRMESLHLTPEFLQYLTESFTIENKSKRAGGGKSPSAKEKKINTKVLGNQRRQNISIPIKKMGLTPQEIVKALEEVDLKVLTEENLDRIQKFLGSEKELKDIRGVMTDIKRKKYRRKQINGTELLDELPPEERLIMDLEQIANSRERVSNLLFTHTFASEYARAAGMLGTLRAAVGKIATAAQSGQLRRILYNVLRFINMLNKTEEKGFRISTLRKIASTKMTKGSGSLMDVIVMHSTTIDNTSSGDFQDEISGLDQACLIEYEEVKGIVKGIVGTVKAIKKTIDRMEQMDNIGNEQNYLDTLQAFYKERIEDVDDMERNTNDCWFTFCKLRQYFHEPEMDMKEFFQVFVDFHADFAKTKEEMEEKKRKAEQRRKAMEAKKARKEAIRARSASRRASNASQISEMSEAQSIVGHGRATRRSKRSTLEDIEGQLESRKSRAESEPPNKNIWGRLSRSARPKREALRKVNKDLKNDEKSSQTPEFDFRKRLKKKNSTTVPRSRGKSLPRRVTDPQDLDQRGVKKGRIDFRALLSKGKRRKSRAARGTEVGPEQKKSKSKIGVTELPDVIGGPARRNSESRGSNSVGRRRSFSAAIGTSNASIDGSSSSLEKRAISKVSEEDEADLEQISLMDMLKRSQSIDPGGLEEKQVDSFVKKRFSFLSGGIVRKTADKSPK